jgi:hypothetical protein
MQLVQRRPFLYASLALPLGNSTMDGEEAKATFEFIFIPSAVDHRGTKRPRRKLVVLKSCQIWHYPTSAVGRWEIGCWGESDCLNVYLYISSPKREGKRHIRYDS